MLITGTQKDLDTLLKSQDEAAYLPLPPSKYIDKKRVNICPKCEHPIAPHFDNEPPYHVKYNMLANEWLCAECGWVPGDDAKHTCVESLCRAVEVDGVMVAQCCDAVRGVTGVRGWVAPVAVREDDLGEIELPDPRDPGGLVKG